MLISGWCCSRRRSGTLIGFYLLSVATNICEWFCQSDILRFCWNCTIKQTCSSSHSSSLQCFLHCLSQQRLRIFLQSGSLIIIIIGVTGRVLILSDILLHWEEALMEERQEEREREGMKCSIVIIIICNCIRPLPKDLHSLAATGFCYLHQQLVAALNYNYRAREPASNTYWDGGGFRTNKLLVVSHPKGSRRAEAEEDSSWGRQRINIFQ